MKRLYLYLFALFFAFSAFAQGEKGHVYLKNGTILKGKLMYIDSGRLSVESAGNTWVIDRDEIDYISGVKKTGQQETKEVRKTPWFFRTEVGVLAGNSENNRSAPFSISGSGNYLFDRNFSAGLGAGVEFLEESYLPVFLNVEYRLRNSASTPYFFVKGGYFVPLEDSKVAYNNFYPASYYDYYIWPGPGYQTENLDAKGGIFVNPGLGYMHLFSPEFGVSFAFGYQFHRLHYKGDNSYGLDIDYNRLTLKVGIIFN